MYTVLSTIVIGLYNQYMYTVLSTIRKANVILL